jgi:crotonobetainyl-CoA:carnitine CoA-transferase CaiB-like acyl-CoA transferase
VHQLPARSGEGDGPRVVGLPISFDHQRPHSARPAPKLGEHTEEVLAEVPGRPVK